MPTTIATKQGVPAARRRRTATAYGFLRSRRLDFLLAVWAITVLRAHASFGGRLLSIIDRVLMTNAQIAYRNGDPPYFGL